MTVLARAQRLIRDATTLNAALLLLGGISFVSSLGIAVMLPLIPLYAISLGASPLQLGLLTSTFTAANVVSQLGASFLIDRLGSLAFIRVGTAIYAAANALIATASSALWLITYRGLAGLGAGGNLIANRVYLADVADPAKLATVSGALAAAASAGQVLGPAVGGAVGVVDLRLPFVLVAVTSGMAFVGTLFLPSPLKHRAHAEAAATAPASAFNRALLVLLASNLFLTAGYGGFITTYAPLATERLGWSTLDVGIVFAFFGAGTILLGPALGHLADRTGRRRVAALACLPVSLFGLSLIFAWPKVAIYAVSVAAGGGVTAFGAAWFAMVTEASPTVRRGRTIGLVSAISNVGVIVGAMTASVAWQGIDLNAGMLVPSVTVLLAMGTLLLLPAPRRRADAPATSAAK